MTTPAPLLHRDGFASRTLILSHIVGTRSAAEREAFWRGYCACLATIAAGSVAVAIALAL
jgi:hypothetical protein